jgi:glutamyl-tRNA synthetase
VIRAEEHLPNTPKQQLLWEALGHTPPVWAHLPLVLNEAKQKLSKRRDKVALEDYRNEGYLADAMRNYLMLLGWAPSGNREIVPWSVIEEEFRLENVNSSPAFFDERKLRAFNGEYIRALPVAEFIDACEPWASTIPGYDRAVFAKVAELAQTRIALLSEIVPNIDFLFLDRPQLDDTAWEKASKDASILPSVIEDFESLSTWEAATLKETLVAVGEGHGLKLGKAQAPVRVAVTGRAVGLPLFESLEVLGRERTLQRLRALASVS